MEMLTLNKKRRRLCLTSSIAAVASATVLFALTAACLRLMAAHYDIINYIDNDPSIYTGMLEDTIGVLWAIIIPLTVFLIVTICISIAKAGDFDENGKISPKGFDNFFLEFHLALIVAAGFLIYVSVIILFTWISRDSFVYGVVSDVFAPDPIPEALADSFGDRYMNLLDVVFDPPAAALAVSLIGIFIALWICRLCILAIVKKLKAHCFWKRTVAGSLCTYLYGACERSPHTFAKVMVASILAILLSATGYGAVPVLILALIFMPRWLNRFNEIAEATNIISSGDLNERISVKGSGDLDRLATSINALADSKDVAVQREIKNQRLKTELISNVSHDLRTPLTSMVSYILLLQKEGLDSPNAPEYLDILSRKTNRLRRLTDDLFEAAKASSGDIPCDIKKIEITSILNQALAELGEKLDQNKINVIISAPETPAFVYADGNLLWRVMENLLTNISKYSVPGSRAYIDITRSEGNIKLEMKNMSKDQLNIDADELMERFRRGDASRNTEGSGLGLSIAKDLTELMHGKFKIEIDGDLFKASAELREAA